MQYLKIYKFSIVPKLNGGKSHQTLLAEPEIKHQPYIFVLSRSAFDLTTLMKNSRWSSKSSRERSIDEIWVCPNQALIKILRISVGIIRNTHSLSTCWSWTIKQQPLQPPLLFLYSSPQHSPPNFKHNLWILILGKWSLSSKLVSVFRRSKWLCW